MTRTKDEILRGLDPTRPDNIQALIDFHRRSLGGYVMEAASDEEGGAAGTNTGTAGTPGGPGDEALGDAGKKALQSEREARKALEKQLSEFQAAQQAQADKLAEAFGIKQPKDATSDDLVTALQKQVQDMRHESLVYRVATEHQITDADDLDLIKGVTDEAAMRKLAARLVRKAADDAATGSGPARRLPLPDPSQGLGADGTRLTGRDEGVAEAKRRFGERKQ